MATWYRVCRVISTHMARSERASLEKLRKRPRQKIADAITRYYDSLTEEENLENRLWGEFCERQIVGTHPPEPQSWLASA
jgi:hypothetical protein